MTPGEFTVSGQLFFGMTGVPKYGSISYRRMATRARIVVASISANHRWSWVTSTCIVLTITCHVSFFVEQRFVFSAAKRKFRHERYEISRKSDTHWLSSLDLRGKTRKLRRPQITYPSLDKMPRVVPEQRQKFENDDLFRKMSRETEVIWQFDVYDKVVNSHGHCSTMLLNRFYLFSDKIYRL